MIAESIEREYLSPPSYGTLEMWDMTALQSCEDSLRRLKLTSVDLYLVHWPVRGISNNTIEI